MSNMRSMTEFVKNIGKEARYGVEGVARDGCEAVNIVTEGYQALVDSMAWVVAEGAKKAGIKLRLNEVANGIQLILPFAAGVVGFKIGRRLRS